MQKAWIKSTSKTRDKTVYFKAILSLVKVDSDKIGFSKPILCLFCKGAGHHLCYPKNIDKTVYFITVL